MCVYLLFVCLVTSELSDTHHDWSIVYSHLIYIRQCSAREVRSNRKAMIIPGAHLRKQEDKSIALCIVQSHILRC